MMTPTPLPRGFHAAQLDADTACISYRTSGMGCLGLFWAVWWIGWTAACLWFTAQALYHPDGVYYWVLLFMVPFWIMWIIVPPVMIYYFWSLTRFILGPDALVIERRFLGWCRRRVIDRASITAVKQVRDGDEETYPSWHLVVAADSEVTMLYMQPRDKGEWLGHVIAAWAGLHFEPAPPVTP
jgi:hypothetical protein